MKYALLLLLFSSMTYANDIKDITKILEHKFDTDPLTCAPDTVDPELAQACAYEVCGQAGSFPNVFTTGRELDDFKPSAEVQDEINRSLKVMDDHTKAWEANANEGIDELLKIIQSNQADMLSVNMIPISLILNKFVKYQVADDKIKMVTNFPHKLDKKVKAGVLSWIKFKEIEIQKDPLIRTRLGLNTPKESMEVLKKTFEDLKTKSTSMPPQMKVSVDQFIAQDIQPLFDDPNPHERNVYAGTHLLARLKGAVTPPSEFTPKQGHPDDSACRDDCIEAFKPLVKKEEFIKRLIRVKSRLSERKRYINACKAGLELQAKYGQLPGQKEKALRLFATTLEKFTSQKWFSFHTKMNFRDFIKSDMEAQHNFDSKDRISHNNLNELMKHISPRFSDALIIETVIRLELQPGNVYASTFPFCPSPSHLGNDSAKYSIVKPTINISPFSCGHEGIGEGIVAHELGHSLSAFLSQHEKKSPESLKKYLSLRKCVNNLSTGKNILLADGQAVNYSGDGLTTEEDMADWTSFESVKAEKPFTCSYIPTDKKRYQQNELSLRTTAGDNHSPPLLRAMRQWHRQKGSLPDKCGQYLAAFKDFVEVKTCE